MKNHKLPEIIYQPNKGETFKCELCEFNTNTVVNINAHIKGHTHLNTPLPKPPGNKLAGFPLPVFCPLSTSALGSP